GGVAPRRRPPRPRAPRRARRGARAPRAPPRRPGGGGERGEGGPPPPPPPAGGGGAGGGARFNDPLHLTPVSGFDIARMAGSYGRRERCVPDVRCHVGAAHGCGPCAPVFRTVRWNQTHVSQPWAAPTSVAPGPAQPPRRPSR